MEGKQDGCLSTAVLKGGTERGRIARGCLTLTFSLLTKRREGEWQRGRGEENPLHLSPWPYSTGYPKSRPHTGMWGSPHAAAGVCLCTVSVQACVVVHYFQLGLWNAQPIGNVRSPAGSLAENCWRFCQILPGTWSYPRCSFDLVIGGSVCSTSCSAAIGVWWDSYCRGATKASMCLVSWNYNVHIVSNIVLFYWPKC